MTTTPEETAQQLADRWLSVFTKVARDAMRNEIAAALREHAAASAASMRERAARESSKHRGSMEAYSAILDLPLEPPQ